MITSLPIELIREIASHLDNCNVLQLARSWRWFLVEVVPSLDPRNRHRCQLQHACRNDYTHLFQSILRMRYAPTRKQAREHDNAAVAPPEETLVDHRNRRIFQQRSFWRSLFSYLRLDTQSPLRGFPLYFRVASIGDLFVPVFFQDWSGKFPDARECPVQLRVTLQLLPAEHVRAKHHLGLARLLGETPWLCYAQILLRSNLPRRPVVEALRRNSTLRAVRLDIEDTLEHFEFDEVMAAIRDHRGIRDLTLNCRYSDIPTSSLRLVMECSQLERFDLLCHGHGARLVGGYEGWSTALNANHSLTVLNMGGCHLGANGAQALANGLLQNQSLRRLKLDKNQLGDRGAEAMAGMLRQNHTLEHLNLNFNDIGLYGARMLKDSTRVNTTLKALYLDNNNFGDPMVMEMLQVLFAKAQQPQPAIYLGGDFYDEDTMLALLEFVETLGEKQCRMEIMTPAMDLLLYRVRETEPMVLLLQISIPASRFSKETLERCKPYRKRISHRV